jgi:Zn-dependent protease with chaperone function
MAAHTLPEDQRLIELSPKAYEHPADRAATAALKSIPMLDTVVRKLIEFSYERGFRQLLLGNAVRLGDDQLPEVWAAHRAALARLDMPEVPDLYLVQMPIINAMAVGSGQPMVLLNSGTVNMLEEAELRTVLGHEAGHILSDHVMYSTALIILLTVPMGTLMKLPFFTGLPLLAVKLALLEWYRAAELSCDRAATLVNRSPMTTCQTLMVIAGGAASRKLSLDAFIRQATDYDEIEPGWDKLTRFRTELFQTHPFPVRRVSELMRWVRSGEYDRVMAGEYRRRSDPNQPRTDAGDATEFYAERFRNLFKEVGEGVNRAGEKVSDAADKLTDWLRRTGTD